MGSRLIEGDPTPGGMVTVHWAPEDAEGWGCVSCRRSWVLNADGEWQEVGVRRWKPQARPSHYDHIHEPPVEFPKMPVCRECGKSEIRLDKDGRVMSHADADTERIHLKKVPCRGRGYMPRWT